MLYSFQPSLCMSVSYVRDQCNFINTTKPSKAIPILLFVSCVGDDQVGYWSVNRHIDRTVEAPIKPSTTLQYAICIFQTSIQP